MTEPTPPPAPTPPAVPPAPTPPPPAPPAAPPAPPAGWSPPSETEWQRVQAALAQANREASERRTQYNELRKQHETAAEQTQREAAEAASQAAEAKYKPAIVRSAAAAAFATAGVTEKPERLIKLLDLDKVTVGDDGAVTGLDGEVKRLQKDYPEFFATATPRAPGRRPAGAGASTPVGTGEKLSSAEIIAQRVVG